MNRGQFGRTLRAFDLSGFSILSSGSKSKSGAQNLVSTAALQVFFFYFPAITLPSVSIPFVQTVVGASSSTYTPGIFDTFPYLVLNGVSGPIVVGAIAGIALLYVFLMIFPALGANTTLSRVFSKFSSNFDVEI